LFGEGGKRQMESPGPDPVLARITDVITVEELHPAPLRPLFEPDGRRLRVPMAEPIERTERDLGLPFPDWLKAVYLSCNGFSGPIGVCSLLGLDGPGGVAGYTLFLRSQESSPAWLQRAIVFSHRRVSWSIDTHWAARDGDLVEWAPGEGPSPTILEPDLFALWRREQEQADRLAAERSKAPRTRRCT
jgi:hypothetical protein